MRSAHCPLRPGHCPLRQRIVRMPITPPQCGLSPERNAPPCCLLRAPHYRSQLSAPRSQLCALSAALSSSRSPPLPAMTTTYAPRAARVCLPALNLSQRTYSYAPCACGLAASVCLVCGLAACSQLQPLAPAPSDDDDLRTSCGPGLPPGAQPLPEDINMRPAPAASPLSPRPRRYLRLSVHPRPRSQR